MMYFEIIFVAFLLGVFINIGYELSQFIIYTSIDVYENYRSKKEEDDWAGEIQRKLDKRIN